jgi:ERCC4-type nuclease
MIQLSIDTRETQLNALLHARDLDIYAKHLVMSVVQLELGDIQICMNDKVWIFERKTVSDLIASIKDGRYKEQKARMMSQEYDITYIIEGDDILCSKTERYQVMLSGAYLHTMYRDNIRMVFTKNVNDTCTFLLTLCSKMIDHPEYFVGVNPQSYVDCIKMKSKKIDNITPELCYIMQLSQIPTISAVIAKNIQSHYPNLISLVKALEHTEDKIGLLCSIDKVGKEKAKKILEYLQLP